MSDYLKMNKEQLKEEFKAVCSEYEKLRSLHLSLDMSRGKPGFDNMDLSEKMFDLVGNDSGFKNISGIDCRNYGGLDGLSELKSLFGEILELDPEQIIVGGNSSLNMMFDTIAQAVTHGLGAEPWGKCEKVKFLCPVPGYDRHFAITEYFGFELISVPTTDEGPDMDTVEELVKDKAVKGIWCVPKYSNPEGITYSDAVVRRMANLKPAASDFKIFWDNAYAVHDLYEDRDELLNIFDVCEDPNMIYEFTSTSKISYPGSGVAVMASGIENIQFAKKNMNAQSIGPDKLNQLRHVKMFKDKAAVLEQMKKHAAILRPKFEAVLDILERDLGSCEIASWSKPKGGYFISFDAMPGCAKRIYELCTQAGVALTTVGGTFPYGVDADDSNIRIAPSFPPIDELKLAVERFTVCVRIASIEKILADR